MKSFVEQNYYEILDIAPHATSFEIRYAYKMASEIYRNGSLTSYSFFSENERERILASLEKAFFTLIDDEARAEYDRLLINLGVIDEESKYRKYPKEPIPILNFKRSRATMGAKYGIFKKVKPRAVRDPVFKEILEQDIVTGEDLKKVRVELGIPLEQIADQTKIRIGLLRSIEDDRFDDLPSSFHLKSFLQSYVQCLTIDTKLIIDRYMRRIKD